MIRGLDFNEFYQLYESGGLPGGHSTGWVSMDPFYTVRPGEWTVVTGIPGHGKSSWVDNVIVNTAKELDWKWLVFSAENRPIKRHAAKLASIYTGKRFNPGPSRMTPEDLLYSAAFIDTHIEFLEPPSQDCNLEHMLLMAESVRRLNALVIDPWTYLDLSRDSHITETEHIKHLLTRLSEFVRERQVHVFIVAHPTKLQRQKSLDTGEMTYPVPTLWDITGSAHFRNFCDNGIVVWRDVLSPMKETEVHVQKIRFAEVGQLGMCRLYYDTNNGRYIDPLTGAKPVFDVKVYRREMNEKIARHEEELMRAEEQLAMQEQ